MALARFLVDLLDQHGSVELGESESHHGSRVLRLAVGDPCVLFDGQGFQALGTVETITKKLIRVAYESRVFAPRDHEGKMHFAIAMPKGDRQRNVIEKLVELGVDRLTPIETSRSVSKFDADAIDRLKRYGIEACKQSQRNRLMQIDHCCSWKEWIDGHSLMSNDQLWVLHPSESLEQIHDSAPRSKEIVLEQAEFISKAEDGDPKSLGQQPRLVFAVGPEGGFTNSEIEQAIQAGWKILDLGSRILRVETAVSSAAVLGSLRLSMNRTDQKPGC